MLPSSHLVPILASPVDAPADAKNSAALLAGAFSEFISASARLESSYRQLQQEVSELGLELAERNAALNTSLAENERMRLALQQIVDSMPCGVLVVDREGAVSMINPESGRLLGLEPALSPDSGSGRPMTLQQISVQSGVNLESFYRSECCSDSEQEFSVRSASGNRSIEIRNRRLFRQGTDSQLDSTANRPDQTILILRDTTAQKRAEQEREAGRKAMALAEITTILAHEIRNPLGSLELFAGLIESDNLKGDEGRRAEWISNLRAGIRSLSGTVNNVLSFHGSGSLPLVPVPLAALIASAIEFVRPIADQAAVSLYWSGESSGAEASGSRDPVLVMGNANALQQVVLNLVTNAVRHTPAGGAVTVSVRLAGAEKNNLGEAAGSRSNPESRVTVEFRDTGCGIRPEQLERVFEPGFSGKGDSSGLGLAVSERIMRQHGGRISVSNALNAGAAFLLDFPILQMELASA